MMKERRQNVAALCVSFRPVPFRQRFSGDFDMQIIARSVNEGVVIGDNVRVTVLEIQSNHVRLGIETPNQIPFYREEVLYFGNDDGGLVVDADQTRTVCEPAVLAVAL